MLNKNIVPIEKIIHKSPGSTNFKDTISLVFHAFQHMALLKSHPDNLVWHKYYNEFEEGINNNSFLLSNLSIIRNDASKRIDLLTPTPVLSSNILINLTYIFHIESYKRTYIYKSYQYYKVLSYKIKSNVYSSISQYSIEILFSILIRYLNYYKKIYNDPNKIEFKLADNIIKQLN